jgi:hypothetical protein
MLANAATGSNWEPESSETDDPAEQFREPAHLANVADDRQPGLPTAPAIRHHRHPEFATATSTHR